MITRGKTINLNVSVLVGALALSGLFVPLTEQSQSCGAYPFSARAVSAGDGSEITAPEFWIFGIQGSPQRSVPLGGRGVRGILDLRTISAPAAIAMLEQYADLNQGLTVTLRWKVPHEEGERLVGKDNYDVPPSPSEAAKALWTLEKVLTSEAAQRLSGNLSIQLYNEVGGGPGKFARTELTQMLDFATEAVQLIRTKAPAVKICGPAVTMGQVQNRHLRDDPAFREQAEIIESFLEWTAKYADYQDVHLHGTDGSAVRQVLVDLREMLSAYPGGADLELVSWEWSPARFPNRDDDAAVRAAILGLWQAMAEGGVKQAAYGSYWATTERREAGVPDIFLWVSVVDENGEPREPIYSTLQDIGMGRIELQDPKPEPDPKSRGDLSDNSGGTSEPDLRNTIATDATALWVAGIPADLGVAQNLGAAGVCDTLDLRVATNKEIKAAVRACATTNLGVVLATRWSDPTDPERYDAMPDTRRANQMVNRLRSTLKSKDARAVAENGLWVQFFAEVAGERGRIRQADADSLFGYAANLADIIRTTAPLTKISGPTLTNLELLNKVERTADEQARFEMLVRAIDWSIKHADAIDFRLEPTSPQAAGVTLQQLRTFIDSRPDGAKLALVCWDWNAGTGAATAAMVADDMNAVYAVLNTAEVLHAAYGPLAPGDDADSTNDAWSLVNAGGEERPRYAEAFVAIARVAGQFARVPTETAAQRKKRLNAFKNEYRLQLRAEYRAGGDRNWKKQSSQAYKESWEAAWEAHEQERLVRYQ